MSHFIWFEVWQSNSLSLYFSSVHSALFIVISSPRTFSFVILEEVQSKLSIWEALALKMSRYSHRHRHRHRHTLVHCNLTTVYEFPSFIHTFKVGSIVHQKSSWGWNTECPSSKTCHRHHHRHHSVITHHSMANTLYVAVCGVSVVSSWRCTQENRCSMAPVKLIRW